MESVVRSVVCVLLCTVLCGCSQALPTGKHDGHRSRRIVTAMVPVRDRQTSSLCSYEVVVDMNPQRIPNKIDRILCKKDACKCVDQGDYRCTQLYSQLNVTYFESDLKSAYEFEVINIEYACVCSRGSGNPGVNVLEPVIV